MTDGSPAWKPHATFALETTSSSASSSPSVQRPKLSPISLFISIRIAVCFPSVSCTAIVSIPSVAFPSFYRRSVLQPRRPLLPQSPQHASHATHRHDHRRMERAGRTALDRRVVHRHVAACRDVPHRHARLHQRKLECETAANHKRDQIGSPILANIGHFGYQFATLPHAVQRHVGTDVGARRGDGCGDARLHHFQQRTRFGIALREQQKIECLLLGQNHQIRLRVLAQCRRSGGPGRQRNAARACSGVLAAPSSVVPISDIPSTIALTFPVGRRPAFSERTADEPRNQIPQKRTFRVAFPHLGRRTLREPRDS